VANVVHHF